MIGIKDVMTPERAEGEAGVRQHRAGAVVQKRSPAG